MTEATVVDYVAISVRAGAALVSVHARHPANAEEVVYVPFLRFLLCARSQKHRLAGRSVDTTSFKTSFDSKHLHGVSG